jgi:biofilm PGA synthesis N-glycosyltransferase PgaC
MSEPMTYAVITPAHNEVENLPRLAGSLRAQTLRPTQWLIVDDSSTDDTVAIADRLAAGEPWVQSLTMPTEQPRADSPDAGIPRGAPVVRAFHVGFDALEPRPDLVVKLDADVSVEPDYFARLLDEFFSQPDLGIASGTCYQLEDGVWRQFYGTGNSVWGAARAYRLRCLEEILPLEERMGWDGIDVIKANVRGWRTAILLDLPFRHHRREAARESGRWKAWAAQGEAAHYMGYRPSYVLARTLFRAGRDPAAAGMLWAYAASSLRRAPRCADPGVRGYIQRTQRLRHLPTRKREALGERR